MAAGKTLARQQTLDTSTQVAWSLTRDNQLRSLLEGMFLALYGPGVVSGGHVTATTGYSVSISAGSVFFAHGVVLTLSVAQSYTAAVANSTVYLWARVLRTQATQSSPTSSDTYSLDVTHNTSGTAPSDDYFCLAVLTTNGAGVAAIDNAPAGKYLRQLPNLGQIEITLSGSDSTLTAAQTRNRILVFAGIGSTVTLPNEAGRAWYVVNDAASAVSLTTATQTTTPLSIAPGTRALVRCDGTAIVDLSPSSTDAVTLAALRADFDELERQVRLQLAHLFTTLGPEFVHPDLLSDLTF